MSVGKRFLDLARGNLNMLLERAAKSELEQRTDEELTAELQRRRSSENAQLEERQRAAAMEAAARARGEKRSMSDPPKKRGTTAAAEGLGRAHRLRALYAELGCKQGASHDELKSAYRALMREHHPDRHAGNAQEQKRASDRAANITTAYAELEQLLAK
ncbi:MAG: J domain-containing protein [Polyangia bacterium]